MHSRLLLIIALLGTALAVGACDRDATQSSAEEPYVGVIDSVLPIPVLLDRFRAQIPDTPTALTGGATSPEGLARQFLAALSANDTAAALGLVITVSEFAWLYYPHTKFTKPPYELGPELAWLTGMGGGPQGMDRLFSKLGGVKLRLAGFSCADSTILEGPNTIIPGCRLQLSVADSAPRVRKLFGALLHRDGRYKFISYANDF